VEHTDGGLDGSPPMTGGDSYSFGNVAGAVQTGSGVQHNVGRDQYLMGSPPSAATEEAGEAVEPPDASSAVLRLRIERDTGGQVVVADSSFGGMYRAPFDLDTDAAGVARFEAALRTTARRDVGEDAADSDAPGQAAMIADQLGATLFAALFTGQVRTGLRQTQTRADVDGVPVRIELVLDATPELAAVPWELLRDEELGRRYALSNRTPIVRHLGVAEPVRRVTRRGPLRVLGMAVSPPDLAPLAVQREWRGIDAELQPAIASGQVELHLVDPPTLDELGRKLLNKPWHVFHFIGHGGWTAEGDAALAFADAGGPDALSTMVRASTLAMTLGDDVDLRVAVLNACHTASGTDRQALDGVAHGLLRQGIPAVVAMQFAISDAGAVVFAERLYAAVASGMSVDRAVVEGRKVLAARGDEWATPTVYLRGDGVVFEE